MQGMTTSRIRAVRKGKSGLMEKSDGGGGEWLSHGCRGRKEDFVSSKAQEVGPLVGPEKVR